MFRVFGLALLVVALATTLVAAQGPLDIIKQIGNPIDPDGDCEIGPIASGVKIRVATGFHDFAADRKIYNAPRIMSKLEGDFILQVRISAQSLPGDKGSAPRTPPYTGAGLLLVHDKSHHISLQAGIVRFEKGPRRYANFEMREKNAIKFSVGRTALDLERDLILRLERTGKSIQPMFKEAGGKWQMYDPVEVEFPNAITGGIYLVAASEGEVTANFTDVTLMMPVDPDLETE